MASLLGLRHLLGCPLCETQPSACSSFSCLPTQLGHQTDLSGERGDAEGGPGARRRWPWSTQRAPGRLGAASPHLPFPCRQLLAAIIPAHTGQGECHRHRSGCQAVLAMGTSPGGKQDCPAPAALCMRALLSACLRRCGSLHFRLCRQSTNLPLIKRALCNLTYTSLHLTPIILRKAQALFQPVGLRASRADLPGT